MNYFNPNIPSVQTAGVFFTDETTRDNVSNVYDQILKLKSHQNGTTLFLPCPEQIKQTITDIDHWPYTRQYRNRNFESNPTVYGREAGWRPTFASCYTPNTCNIKSHKPKICFQAPCSTVYPCDPVYMMTHGEKGEFDVALPKACNSYLYP